MALVSGQLNFPVLETCFNFQQNNNKFQRMSIALPDKVISEILKIQNCQTTTNEIKQLLIANKLSETQGYFFNHDNQLMGSRSFRHSYLEICDETLESFIQNQTKENDFQWTILQEMCHQLVDSVAWLHQTNIYNDGRLHPRNIFVKRSEDARWKVKLKIPEKLNPFNNLDELYTQLWSSLKKPDSGNETIEEIQSQEIQRDLISIAILLYFIQSSGAHPFQLGGLNQNKKISEGDYEAIRNQIEVGIFNVEVLDKTCFCNVQIGCDSCEEKMGCKYRLWINSLAKDNTKKMLTELFQESKQYTNQSVEKLKEHPFFWKTADVLTFMERSSSYLHEGGNQTIQSKFGVSNTSKNRSISAAAHRSRNQPWILDQSIFSQLQQDGENGNDYKHIFEYLHEIKNLQTSDFSLRKITSFGMLLKQIRNKSCHWNEETERGKKAKEVLKNIRFVTSKKTDDGQTNFCLFWLIHFPTLLLYTWEQLKDEIALK